MASGFFNSTTKSLAYGAVSCRAGSEATAIGWLGFVIAAGNAMLIVFQRRRHLGGPWIESMSTQASTYVSVREQEGDVGIEMEEQPPEPTWQQPQMSPNVALLLYLAGLRDNESSVRHRSTAAWVDQNERMHQGFAETIVEGP